MPRGRKKSQTTGQALRLAREGSEESSTADEAPKLKDSRLDACYMAASENTSPTRRTRMSKITDYFSPSRSGPPLLLPEVPLNDDRASDRSEGGDSSGKENDEDFLRRRASPASSPVRRMAEGPSGDAPQPQTTANRVMTRSAKNKMPLLSLSSSNTAASPPSSPTKSPSSQQQQQPKSPPTPHKIKLLGEQSSSPAAAALQKLKLSLVPKKMPPEVPAPTTQKSQKGPKKRQTQAAAAAAAALPGATAKSGAQQKTKSKAASATAKLEAAASESHKVTEYFPIRRSGRKPKGTLEQEYLADVEHHLLADNDDDLDVAVEDFGEKGRGVVARRDYSRGEFIVEYAGDLIDIGSAKERESKYSLDLSTGCYMYYFKHKGKQYCIDATSESGRLGRLVNHSRLQPNLQTKVVTFKDKPRLILVAKKEIEAGAELLYDYGDRSKESLKAHPWLAL